MGEKREMGRDIRQTGRQTDSHFLWMLLQNANDQRKSQATSKKNMSQISADMTLTCHPPLLHSPRPLCPLGLANQSALSHWLPS